MTRIKKIHEFVNEAVKKYVKLPNNAITLDSHFVTYDLQDKFDHIATSLNTDLFATKKRIEKRGGTPEAILKTAQEKIDRVLPADLKVDWNSRISEIEQKAAKQEYEQHHDKYLTNGVVYICCPIESTKHTLSECYILIKIYPWWTFPEYGTSEFVSTEFHDRLVNCGYKASVPQYTEILIICNTNTDMRTNYDARNYIWM